MKKKQKIGMLAGGIAALTLTLGVGITVVNMNNDAPEKAFKSVELVKDFDNADYKDPSESKKPIGHVDKDPLTKPRVFRSQN